MDLALLSQISTWGLGHWAIAIIVAAGVIGIVFVIVKQTGVPIPAYIFHILGILLAVVIGVVAIKFLLTML